MTEKSFLVQLYDPLCKAIDTAVASRRQWT
eukprot:SAG31_NODE_44781_length_261_cov_0.833333_1_plen_29_part_10